MFHLVLYCFAMSTATVQQIGQNFASWPDFAARRRAIFREQVLPAGTSQALVDEDRGA